MKYLLSMKQILASVPDSSWVRNRRPLVIHVGGGRIIDNNKF